VQEGEFAGRGELEDDSALVAAAVGIGAAAGDAVEVAVSSLDELAGGAAVRADGGVDSAEGIKHGVLSRRSDLEGNASVIRSATLGGAVEISVRALDEGPGKLTVGAAGLGAEGVDGGSGSGGGDLVDGAVVLCAAAVSGAVEVAVGGEDDAGAGVAAVKADAEEDGFGEAVGLGGGVGGGGEGAEG